MLSHLGAAQEAAVGEVQSLPGARVLHTRELPLVWTFNQVHVTGPVAVADAVALADAHQGDLPYRHLVVDDDASGARLASALGGAWTIEREVLLVLRGEPRTLAPGGSVVDVGEHDMLRLMRRWHRDEHPGMSADEYHRLEGRLTAERCFGAAGDDGRPAALAKVRVGGDSGWVEDVYTAPEARRRGLARRVVTHACEYARAGGAALVFLVADAHDWPQHLYADIGFAPVGRRWLFHRHDAG